MSTLLALDVDGTLADTSRFAPLWDADRFAWHEAVARGDHPPLRQAVEALASVAHSDVVLVTSRPITLWVPTRVWITANFAQLDDAPLFMRGTYDGRPGWQVKRDHLEHLRRGRDVVLVDDDPEAHRALTGAGDVHLRPPGDWHLLRQALGVR